MTTSVTVNVSWAGKRPTGGPQPSPRLVKASAPNADTNAARARARVRPPAPSSRAATDRLARQLALAHLVERMIDAGEIGTFAEAARRLGVTTSRLSQVMDLLGLAPEAKETILIGTMRASERGLRIAGPKTTSSFATLNSAMATAPAIPASRAPDPAASAIPCTPISPVQAASFAGWKLKAN